MCHGGGNFFGGTDGAAVKQPQGRGMFPLLRGIVRNNFFVVI